MHSQHLVKYADSTLEVSKEMKDNVLFELFPYKINSFVGCELIDDEWCAQIKYQGALGDDEVTQWEQVLSLRHVFPAIFEKWWKKLSKSKNGVDKKAYQSLLEIVEAPRGAN